MHLLKMEILRFYSLIILMEAVSKISKKKYEILKLRVLQGNLFLWEIVNRLRSQLFNKIFNMDMKLWKRVLKKVGYFRSRVWSKLVQGRLWEIKDRKILYFKPQICNIKLNFRSILEFFRIKYDFLIVLDGLLKGQQPEGGLALEIWQNFLNNFLRINLLEI